MTDDTVTFLLQALQRLDGGSPASQVQTHISVLLLGKTLAWKLKNPAAEAMTGKAASRQPAQTSATVSSVRLCVTW